MHSIRREREKKTSDMRPIKNRENQQRRENTSFFFPPQRCRHYRHGLIHPMGWKVRCTLYNKSSGAIQLYCQEFTWYYSSFIHRKSLRMW